MNLWRCFGECSTGGDAIAFLRKKDGLTFPEALDRLVPRNGNGNGHEGSVSSSKSPGSRSEKPDPETAPEASIAPAELEETERARLLESIVRHHEAALARSPRAQGYLKKRGLLVPQVLKAHRVGYADGTLVRAVAAKGETREQLVALGVLTDEGREAMTGMIVVPLLDPKSGAVVSLYGRSIIGSRHHYLKGGHRGLFNGTTARTSEEIILVESVIDALSLIVLGIHNVLPLYGTNGWTKEHERVLEESAVKRVGPPPRQRRRGPEARPPSLGEKLARPRSRRAGRDARDAQGSERSARRRRRGRCAPRGPRRGGTGRVAGDGEAARGRGPAAADAAAGARFDVEDWRVASCSRRAAALPRARPLARGRRAAAREAQARRRLRELPRHARSLRRSSPEGLRSPRPRRHSSSTRRRSIASSATSARSPKAWIANESEGRGTRGSAEGTRAHRGGDARGARVPP